MAGLESTGEPRHTEAGSRTCRGLGLGVPGLGRVQGRWCKLQDIVPASESTLSLSGEKIPNCQMGDGQRDCTFTVTSHPRSN